MNIKTIITNHRNKDFHELIKLLDEDLAVRYGATQEQYQQHNNIDLLTTVILVYEDNKAVACGAYKEYDKDSVEI